MYFHIFFNLFCSSKQNSAYLRKYQYILFRILQTRSISFGLMNKLYYLTQVLVVLFVCFPGEVPTNFLFYIQLVSLDTMMLT